MKLEQEQYDKAKPLLLPDEEFKLVVDGKKIQFSEVIDNQELEDMAMLFGMGNKEHMLKAVAEKTLLKNQTGDVFYLQEEFVEYDFSRLTGIKEMSIGYKGMWETPLYIGDKSEIIKASQMQKEHARYFLVTTDVRVEEIDGMFYEVATRELIKNANQ